MGGLRVEVSTRSFAVPFECPCCGAVPETELAITGPRDQAPRRSLWFPYCRRCADHAAGWEQAGMMSAAIMVLGLSAAVAVGLATRAVIGLALAGGTIAAAWLLANRRRAAARGAMGASCASPGVAVSYLGGEAGTRALAFESPTYTARFAEQNTRALTHVGEGLRRLLEAHRIARLAVPTPAAAITVASPPPSPRDWIAKLEACTGRVACRNLLERALEVVSDPVARRDLIGAASRLELAAVLERLRRLSSRAAQERHLRHAIDEVHADNLPEELRAAELEQLEARLAEL